MERLLLFAAIAVLVPPAWATEPGSQGCTDRSSGTREGPVGRESAEELEELMDEGFRLLEDLEFKRAIRVGKRLKKLQHSSGFEILATAYAEQDDKARAIRELEEGVRRAPGVWRLWQLLGNYYSDEERYDAAQRAYRCALACSSTNAPSVHLNRAIALGRERKYPDALRALDQVTDEELLPRAGVSRMEFLNALGQHAEAISLGRKLLDTSDDDEDQWIVGSVHAELGHAIWMSTGDAAGALAEAWNALQFRTDVETALWLIREVRNRRSPEGRYFRIRVHGQEREEQEEWQSFVRGFDVVADTPERALEYAKEFERAETRPTVKLKKAKVVKATPELPEGVYFATGHVYYGVRR